MHKVSGALLFMLTVLSSTIIAAEETAPEIDLLEFLGTIAGLESMGVDIDLLLDDPESNQGVVSDNDENDE